MGVSLKILNFRNSNLKTYSMPTKYLNGQLSSDRLKLNQRSRYNPENFHPCTTGLTGNFKKNHIRPSANKDSYCWGQDIPNNNFKSIEYIRQSSCIFKMIGPEENMLKISWQSGVPSRSYQQ